MLQEIWKPVPGYEGLYEASSMGRVRSVDRVSWNGRLYYKTKGRVLKVFYAGKMGYGSVTLSKDGKTKTFRVHVLVALTFHGKRPDGMEVGHKDGNAKNNAASNLEYMTRQQNIRQSYKDSGLGANRNKLEKFIEYNGKRQNLSDWSRELGGSANLVFDRLEIGWSEIEAVSVPKGHRSSGKHRDLMGRFVSTTNGFENRANLGE